MLSTTGHRLYVRTKIVIPEDPRLVVTLNDLEIDDRTGLPDRVEKGLRLPDISPERLRGIRPVDELLDEASRVHRSLPAIGAARLTWSTLVYKVPAFSQTERNEMTDAHRGFEARREAIPLYEWVLLTEPTDRPATNRIVWIDARTGRGLAAVDIPLPTIGEPKLGRPSSAPSVGRWRLGRMVGTFAKATAQNFEGLPIVVTNEKREVLTLRFDAKLGLVRDDSGTYRPDAALLKAMRGQGPVKAFGEKAKR